jgi:hypothetical protein
MTIYFIIIIIIFIFFFLINNFILNKSYEKFEKMKNGLLCGTNNDICRINEYGISSCCDNYRCVRPDGNFQYKICVDKDKLINSNLLTDLSTKLSTNLSTKINIKIPSLDIQTPNINPEDVKFPSIQSINLQKIKNNPIFTKDFWTHMFEFDFCPNQNVYKKKNNLLEEEYLSEEEYLLEEE